MRKIIITALAFTALIVMTACQGDRKDDGKGAGRHIQVPEMELSKNDTMTVRTMTKDFLELVMKGEVDVAMSQLFVLENDKVAPLPRERYNECRFALSAFDFYGYDIDYIIFRKETDSEVKYHFYLEDPAGKSKPAQIGGLIRPVRRDGKWYITLANTEDASVKN